MTRTETNITYNQAEGVYEVFAADGSRDGKKVAEFACWHAAKVFCDDWELELDTEAAR